MGKNSKHAEASFILSILSDLKKYPGHNEDEIDYIIQLVKRRVVQLSSN